MFRSTLGLLISCLMCASPLQAQGQVAAAQPNTGAPHLMRMGCVLLDATGQPIIGPVELTFALYAAQVGGEPLWSETQSVEADERGGYRVTLGVKHEAGLPIELFPAKTMRWLGVQVGSEAEQTPRMRVFPIKENSALGVLKDGGPLPLAQKYVLWLRGRNLSYRIIAEREAKGEDESAYWDRERRSLGMSDAQILIIRETAERIEAESKESHSRARAIGDAYRASHPPDPGEKANLLPPEVNDELRQLDQECNETVEREVTDLKIKLGAETADRLDGIIESSVSSGRGSAGAPPPLVNPSNAPAQSKDSEVPR